MLFVSAQVEDDCMDKGNIWSIHPSFSVQKYLKSNGVADLDLCFILMEQLDQALMKLNILPNVSYKNIYFPPWKQTRAQPSGRVAYQHSRGKWFDPIFSISI